MLQWIKQFLLFVVFINDLPDGLCCQVKIIADDTKVCKEGSLKGETDREQLHEATKGSFGSQFQFNPATACTKSFISRKARLLYLHMADVKHPERFSWKQ